MTLNNNRYENGDDTFGGFVANICVAASVVAGMLVLGWVVACFSAWDFLNPGWFGIRALVVLSLGVGLIAAFVSYDRASVRARTGGGL
jgi:hypothetical protein